MKNTAVAALVFGMLLAPGPSSGQTEKVSARQTRLLEQEYALAKNPSTYFVFNFATRTVSLKSKGFVLKEWPIARMKMWGRAGGVMTYPLVKKTAYRAPQRKDITPGKTEPENKPAAKKDDDLDIMELRKMPVDYALELPDDIQIKVRLQKKGLGRLLGGIGRFFSRGIGLSVKTISRGLKKRPFTEIELVFTDANAAKNIYWAFFEGQKCVLFWPE